MPKHFKFQTFFYVWNLILKKTFIFYFCFFFFFWSLNFLFDFMTNAKVIPALLTVFTVAVIAVVCLRHRIAGSIYSYRFRFSLQFLRTKLPFRLTSNLTAANFGKKWRKICQKLFFGSVFKVILSIHRQFSAIEGCLGIFFSCCCYLESTGKTAATFSLSHWFNANRKYEYSRDSWLPLSANEWETDTVARECYLFIDQAQFIVCFFRKKIVFA